MISGYKELYSGAFSPPEWDVEATETFDAIMLGFDILTPTEKLIFYARHCLQYPLSYMSISERVFMSPQTVKTKLGRTYGKMRTIHSGLADGKEIEFHCIVSGCSNAW